MDADRLHRLMWDDNTGRRVFAWILCVLSAAAAYQTGNPLFVLVSLHGVLPSWFSEGAGVFPWAAAHVFFWFARPVQSFARCVWYAHVCIDVGTVVLVLFTEYLRRRRTA